MRSTTTRILTTHAGSLPHLREPAPATEQELRDAVDEVVARQRELGIDLVNERFADFYRYASDRGTLFYSLIVASASFCRSTTRGCRRCGTGSGSRWGSSASSRAAGCDGRLPAGKI
ncbi:MAG: hypothetical protein ACRDMJ_09680, partial [Solirubrobacteraceae bacterium]